MMRTLRLRDFNALLLTRERGRQLGEALPVERHMVLDCRGVKAISPSFLDELIRTASERGIELSFKGVPDRLRPNLELLEQARERRPAHAV